MNTEALKYLQEVCLSKICPKEVEHIYNSSTYVQFLAEQLITTRNEINILKIEKNMLLDIIRKN